MLTFKQYLAEMAGAKRGFIRKAQDAENLVASSAGNKIPEENEDDKRANRITDFIKKTVTTDANKLHPNNYIDRVYDTRTKVAAGKTRSTLKIPNYSSGRRVEDMVMTTPHGKNYLIDLKLGPRESAGSLSARKINMLYSGSTPETERLKYRDRVAKKELVSHQHPLSDAKSKRKNIQNLHNHFNIGIVKEELKNSKNITDKNKKKEYVKIKSHERRERIVKELLNVHENIPENVKRFQVKDSTEGTKIYDTDHVWNTFQQKFKPTRYSSVVKGNTKKIFAHNENGEKFHILSIGVKYSNVKKGEGLDYNVKHYLIPNMEGKYGYKPHAELKH